MFKYVLVVLMMVLGAGSCVAGSAKQPDHVTRATLDNGLRVVIVHSDLAPVVTVNMAYLVGSDEASAEFPGTAHALEHMMFRGSPGLSRDQLLTIAANLGGSYNASTSRGVTQYYFTVPAQDLDVALHVASIRMRGLDLTEAGWAKERGAIEQEVARDMSSPSYKYHLRLYKHVFAGTPYAHVATGTRASFEKTTAAQLRAFYDKWYVPNNAVLTIGGDVDAEAALATIRRLFGNIPSKPLPDRPTFDFRKVQAKTLTEPTDSSLPMVVLAWRMPGANSKAFAAGQVLRGVLASRRGKLHALGLTGKAQSAAFGTSVFRHAGMAYAWASYPRGGDAKKQLRQLHQIIQDVVSGGVSEDLFKAAKNKQVSAFEYLNASISGMASSWVSAVAFRGQHSPDVLRQALAGVTKADVDALARKIFRKDRVVTIALTPSKTGKARQQKASKSHGEHVRGRPSGKAILPAWASKAFATLEAPHSILHPARFTLDNGIQVVVQPETISHVVLLAGKIRTNGDLQTPEGKMGVSGMVSRMFRYGTAFRSRQAFAAATDALQAYVHSGTSFGVVATSEHFADALKLLAEQQLHPAFRPKAFKIMQRNKAHSRAGYLKTPDWQETLAYLHAMYPADAPQQRHSTPASVKGLTLDDVKAYYRQVYRPDMTSIVVVGDITPARARELVVAAFGDWKATGPKPEVDYPKPPLNQPGRFYVPNPTAVQASVELIQLTGLTSHHPDRFAMSLGNQILGSGLDSRLMQSLRVHAGLVYGVNSSYSTKHNYGKFEISFACDPDKLERARALAMQELRRMQNEPVSAAELHAAKGKRLRQLILGQSSYGAIGSALLSNLVYGYPDDMFDRTAKALIDTTPADIQRVFRKYVRADGFVTDVMGPTKGQ